MKKLALLMILCMLVPTMPVFANESTSLVQYLQRSLTPDEYGGIYLEEGRYHIRPLAASRNKVLQTVEKAKKAVGSDAISVDDNVQYSIRELALTRRILQSLSTEYQYRNYVNYNIKDNAVCIPASKWTDEMKENLMAAAGADNITFENNSGEGAINYAYLPIIRINEERFEGYSEKQVEWYSAVGDGKTPNFIDAGSFNTPIYEKDGVLMIPLLNFTNTFPKGINTIWDAKKQEVTVRGQSNTTILSIGSGSGTIYGIKQEDPIYSETEMHNGVPYASERLALTLCSAYSPSGNFAYDEEFQVFYTDKARP